MPYASPDWHRSLDTDLRTEHETLATAVATPKKGTTGLCSPYILVITARAITIKR